nr:uncharacterized protein LOC112545464 [Pelodiscus sinensis]|eukprot:XP_025039414.1 uncharacterized protein LOC112545464 [Pelodiscus sinensis]
MVTLASIIPALDKGDCFMSLDLQDAYFHITIYPAHRRFLQFIVGADYYQYQVLTFQTFSSAMSFFQDPGGGGGLPSSPQHHDLSIFGRLPIKGPHTRRSYMGSYHYRDGVRDSRSHNQFREVLPDTESRTRVRWCKTQFSDRKGVLTHEEVPTNLGFGTDCINFSQIPHTFLSTDARPYGSYHICGTACETPPAQPSTLAILFTCPVHMAQTGQFLFPNTSEPRWYGGTTPGIC